MIRAAARVICLIALASCQAQAPSPAERFAAWRTSHATAVDAYEAWRQQRGLADIADSSALLRSSRRWQPCEAAEFDVPAPAQWPAMAPTLRLLAQLQARRLADASLIRSGYRSPALNQCSGGSPRSQHLRNNALDLDLPDSVSVSALCAFWRAEGPRHRMGLGFYTPTRIHIDTAGFRTWGTDHHRASSLCVQPAG